MPAVEWRKRSLRNKRSRNREPRSQTDRNAKVIKNVSPEYEWTGRL